MKSVEFRCFSNPERYSRLQIISMVLILALSTSTLATAQHHGLSWGFDSGDKFYFKETIIQRESNYTVSSLSYNYYIVTQNNYTIPDPFTYFPFAKEELFYYNGTPVMTGYFEFAVPIGNWELLGTLFLTMYSSNFDTVIIIDEETVWGYHGTKNETYSEESKKAIFSKTDGVMMSFHYEINMSIGHVTSIFIERVAPPLFLDSIVLVGAGAFVLAIAVAIYLFKRVRKS